MTTNDIGNAKILDVKPSNLRDEESLTDDEIEEIQQASSDAIPVTYSGQDFDIDGLVRRLQRQDIVIPQFGLTENDIESAGFQRGFVWNKSQMDRFIESLLLGYPIPGIFLVRQADKRYLVLDGQQRLKTLQYFIEGKFSGKEFSLKNVAQQFKGLTYQTLPEDIRRTFENAFLQATIVAADPTPDGLNSIYQIFERLNSGGTQLTAHEIRVALYAGPLIEYLAELNNNSNWRELYGVKNNRIRDQELILRILALYVSGDDYTRPLKGFLNQFTARFMRNADDIILEAGELFIRSSEILNKGPKALAIRRASGQVNNSLTDANYVGLMRRLAVRNISPDECTAIIKSLRENKEFEDAITGPTADEKLVKGRIKIATSAFNNDLD